MVRSIQWPTARYTQIYHILILYQETKCWQILLTVLGWLCGWSARCSLLQICHYFGWQPASPVSWTTCVSNQTSPCSELFLWSEKSNNWAFLSYTETTEVAWPSVANSLEINLIIFHQEAAIEFSKVKQLS